VKNPAYPDTRYVSELVAPGVVNTMPVATLEAVADHGEIGEDSITGHYDEARQVLEELEAVGVGYDDVVATLEDQGVAAFDASWDQLGEQLAEALNHR
jgi:transaldolase